MASVYSGGPLPSFVGPITRQDTPAYLVTEPVQSADIFFLQTLTLEVSGDGGATFTQIPFTAPLNFSFTIGDAQSFVNTMNILMTGFGSDTIEWFVPPTDSATGLQIGVRTAVYTGKRAMIRVVSGTAIPNGFNWRVGSIARGVEGYTQFLIGPSPGDPFTALSVNNYQSGLRSRDYHIIHKMGKATDSKGMITATSTNGTSIDVGPVAGVQFNPVLGGVITPYYYFDIDGIVGLDHNYLDIPGNFVANTWYYVYVYYRPPGGFIPAGFAWEISVTPPNIYNLFKTGDTSRKYLFPFRVGLGGLIVPFIRNGNTQTYLTKHNLLSLGNATMLTPFSASNFIPPTSQLGLLGITIDNSAFISASLVSVGPDIAGIVGTAILCNALDFSINQFYVGTSSTQNYHYEVQDAATLLDVDIFGFRD